MDQVLGFLKGMVEERDAIQRREPVSHVGNGVIHLNEDPPALHDFSPDYYSRNPSESHKRGSPRAGCGLPSPPDQHQSSAHQHRFP